MTGDSGSTQPGPFSMTSPKDCWQLSGPKSDTPERHLGVKDDQRLPASLTHPTATETHTHTHTGAARLSSDRRLPGHLIINWLPGGWRQRAGPLSHTSCGRASWTETTGQDRTDRQTEGETDSWMDGQAETDWEGSTISATRLKLTLKSKYLLNVFFL